MDNVRLLRNPDIYGSKIVFSYAGDLWLVDTTGGDAERLTSHPGIETDPFFSPDGKWIAFTGQYDGNTDVYIIPSKGGEPKRLTYHPRADQVVGWDNTGKFILFSSPRESYSRFTKIFKVSINGGLPESLPMPMAWLGAMSNDGNFFAYTSLSNRQSFNTWRRYRGGHAPFIWLFNLTNNTAQRITNDNSNNTYPKWLGNNIIFLSDRTKVMNLYSYNPKTNKINELTNYTGADIKTFGCDNNLIVFEREGYLHILNPKTKKIKKLTININADIYNIRPKYVKANIFSGAISPNGKRAVFEARGEIVTVPYEHGDIRNLSNTTNKMERLPKWSPDGKKIAYFGEHNNKYALIITDQKGEKKEIIPLKTNAYYNLIKWSPDSKKILYITHDQKLYYIDLVTKKIKLIDIENKQLTNIFADWSPDNKWIVYTKTGKNKLRALHLYSLKKDKSYQITDGLSDATNPVFDKTGKYIYFAASTNTAFDLGWVDLSQYPYQPTNSLYLIVLSKNQVSPFKPVSDEENTKPEKKDKKDDKNKKKNNINLQIDIDNIQDRIVALPLSDGVYSMLQAVKDKLYFIKNVGDVRNGAPRLTRSDLYSFDLKKKKEKLECKNINYYEISANNKKILYVKNKAWFIGDLTQNIEKSAKKLKTNQIEVLIDPQKEYKQMLYEAWRINKLYFYDPGMHGQNWDSIWTYYKEYVPYIAHRKDLNYVIGQMIGELCVGHAYVGGGLYPETKHIPCGLLGADYEIANGLYRIKKIYKGENWNPDLRSPLTEPGINIKEGDYILEVNGKKVEATKNIYSYFIKTAGVQTRIKVSKTPDGKNAKEYTVVPISNETNLRNREWMDNNRKIVEKLSNGKLGYVYLPNTSVQGYINFMRYYFSNLDKEGMIIDERFNGGGYAADNIIDLLSRKLLNYWVGRWGDYGKTPEALVEGPKVMIINEYAGSGGDALPYYFKKLKLGKLVGKRTWGGLVGIIGYPHLMDGGYVTAPNIAIVDTDGKFAVENVGVSPDIEVEFDPASVIKGHDPQLEKAVETALEELKKHPVKKFKREDFPRGR